MARYQVVCSISPDLAGHSLLQLYRDGILIKSSITDYIGRRQLSPSGLIQLIMSSPFGWKASNEAVQPCQSCETETVTASEMIAKLRQAATVISNQQGPGPGGIRNKRFFEEFAIFLEQEQASGEPAPPVSAPPPVPYVPKQRGEHISIPGFVSHRDYAYLSYCVYKKLGDPSQCVDEVIPATQALPVGRWRLFASSEDHPVLDARGFFAIAYISDTLQSVVIAIRGTQPAINWVANFAIWWGYNSTIYFDAATPFFERVKTKLATDRARRHYAISFTGHSLGAYLAQLLAWEYNFTSVGFESPGIYQGSVHLCQTKYNNTRSNATTRSGKNVSVGSIFGYTNVANVVNGCRDQIGSVFLVEKLNYEQRNHVRAFFEAGAIMAAAPSVLEKLAAEGVWSAIWTVGSKIKELGMQQIELHKMAALLKYFVSAQGVPEIEQVIVDWPVGFEEWILYQFSLPDPPVIVPVDRKTIDVEKFPRDNGFPPEGTILSFYRDKAPRILADVSYQYNPYCNLLRAICDIFTIDHHQIEIKDQYDFITAVELTQAMFMIYYNLPAELKSVA